MSEHVPHRQLDADTCTNEELLHVALTEADEDAAWHAITELQRRGDRDVFDRACGLCTAQDALARRVGADILGQLGWRIGQPGDAFHEETMAVLLAMLEHEQDPQVLYSIAIALGHRQDPRAIGPLAALKNHPDELVRYGVVHGISGHKDEMAIQTLIELSTDPDADVRDWATFGLGSMIDADTPAIRAALFARLADDDSDTRGEAMVGLARRHDQRMVEQLLNDLEAGWSGRLRLEAAARIADPRLYPILLQRREEWIDDKENWLYKELEEAIARCRPASESQ
jgi:HEAT repeat protein